MAHCSRSGQGLAPPGQPPKRQQPPRISLSAFLCPRLSLSFPGAAPRRVALASSADGGDPPSQLLPIQGNPRFGIPGNALAVLPLGEGARLGHQETEASLRRGGPGACTQGLALANGGRAELGRVTDPAASASSVSGSRAVAAACWSMGCEGCRGAR